MTDITTFKPMLSATVTDAERQLTYPLVASPKLDGIRAVVIDGVVYSRNLKPIPNKHVQKLFGRKVYNGLDGELIVGNPAAPDAFLASTSGVMSIQGTPDVRFYVFDCFTRPELPFTDRLAAVDVLVFGQVHAAAVAQEIVYDVADLEAFERQALQQGYEGVMLRKLDSTYKFGRGTMRAQDLMKLKRFADDEATVVGFDEQMRNDNEATTDALGHTARSTKKAGLAGKGTLGALQVVGVNGPYKGVAFNIGTGFNDELRATIWANKDSWMGRLIKFKYFPTGSKAAPRFPVFMGTRDQGDMS